MYVQWLKLLNKIDHSETVAVCPVCIVCILCICSLPYYAHPYMYLTLECCFLGDIPFNIQLTPLLTLMIPSEQYDRAVLSWKLISSLSSLPFFVA